MNKISLNNIYLYIGHLLFHTVTKFIRTGIADKNIHPPYFEKTLYEADVEENEDLHHTVLTVTATDHDEGKLFKLKILPTKNHYLNKSNNSIKFVNQRVFIIIHIII